MTKEDIVKLAERTRKEKYCNQYKKQHDCGSCPLLDTEDGIYCQSYLYDDIAFYDGFNVAMDLLELKNAK